MSGEPDSVTRNGQHPMALLGNSAHNGCPTWLGFYPPAAPNAAQLGMENYRNFLQIIGLQRFPRLAPSSRGRGMARALMVY